MRVVLFQTATATVTIEVIDANDNNPVIVNGDHIKASIERKQNELVHEIEVMTLCFDWLVTVVLYLITRQEPLSVRRLQVTLNVMGVLQ